MNASATDVEAESLRKTFGRRVAVDGVSLSLAAGDSLAVFGPNGAGKTTLLRLVAGLLKPTAGVVRLRGIEVRRDPAARASVGLISHHSMLYAPLTVLENVEFSARLYGMRDARSAARAALETMRVIDRADAPVRTLSRGLQQRVSIARAIVHRPHVLLLDEPYSGLDDPGSQALTAMLRALRESGAILIVITHNVSEGLALASHAAIMNEGRFLRFERRERFSDAETQRYVTEYRAAVGQGHVA